MSQNTSASLGCILELISACALLLLDLHVFYLLVSRACTVLGAAGGGVCWAHLLIPFTGLWAFCGYFSCHGEKERNCAWVAQALLIPAQSVVRGPGRQLQPRTADPTLCDQGPQTLLSRAGNLPCSLMTIGCVFPGLFQAVRSVAICSFNPCMLHLHSVFCELLVK